MGSLEKIQMWMIEQREYPQGNRSSARAFFCWNYVSNYDYFFDLVDVVILKFSVQFVSQMDGVGL